MTNVEGTQDDSVDGIPAFNSSVTAVKHLHANPINLENQTSDVNSSGITTQVSGTSGSIPAIAERITSQLHGLQASTGSGSVPQVIIVNSNDRNSLLGKRPAEGTPQNSLVNKIIITKNTNASQVYPVQVQTINASQSVTAQGASVLTDNSSTVAKTITISQQGIVSPVKGITMAQVVGTPPKLPINRVTMSPAKTPTKITMIPVSARSPQRIAPAGAGSTVITNSTTVQAVNAISPTKIIRQPGTVHVVSKFLS